MNLTDKQVDHLDEVVNYIIEFEEADYYDWLRDTGEVVGENHIYYHAKQLQKLLED